MNKRIQRARGAVSLRGNGEIHYDSEPDLDNANGGRVLNYMCNTQARVLHIFYWIALALNSPSENG